MSTDEINLQETPAEVLEKVKSAASEGCHTICNRTKEAITRNPVPAVLGVLVFGAAAGYLLASSRREQEAIADRLLRETEHLGKRLGSASDRLSALLHDQAETLGKRAKSASGYVQDHVPHVSAREVLDSVSDSLHRFRNRVKFW